MMTLTFEHKAFAELTAFLKDLKHDLEEDKQEFLRRAGDRAVMAARAHCPRSPHVAGFTPKVSERPKPPVRDTIQRSEPVKEGDNWRVGVGFDNSNVVEHGKAAGTPIGELIVSGTAPHVIRPRPENKSGRLFFHELGNIRHDEKSGGRRAGLVRQRGKKAGEVRESVPRGKGRHAALAETLIVAKEVHHPGTAPNPFLETAFNEVHPNIIADYEALMARKLRGR